MNRLLEMKGELCEISEMDDIDYDGSTFDDLDSVEHSDDFSDFKTTKTQSANQSNNARPFQCDKCPKCFKRRAHLKRHQLLHTGEKPYPCLVCGERFTRPENRVRHTAQFHNQNCKFVCEICAKGFPNMEQKKQHVKTHSIDNTIFLCHICSKTYNNADHLKNHMKTHPNIVGDDKRQLHQCDLCYKRFMRRDHMLRHRETHSGIKRYECNVCHKRYSRKDNQTKHQADCLLKNGQPEQFELDNKDKCKAEMVVNKIETKSKDRRYDCTTCEKSFPSEHSQIKHEASCTLNQDRVNENGDNHLNEFTIVDPLTIIDAFTQSEGTFNADSETDEGNSSLDKIHISTNSGEMDANKGSNTSLIICRSAKLPLLTQEEIETLTCNVCSKQLSQKYHLQRHKIIHLNKKPYECQVCSKEFARAEHLRRHLRTHGIEYEQRKNKIEIQSEFSRAIFDQDYIDVKPQSTNSSLNQSRSDVIRKKMLDNFRNFAMRIKNETTEDGSEGDFYEQCFDYVASLLQSTNKSNFNLTDSNIAKRVYSQKLKMENAQVSGNYIQI